jgi:2-polyprenyl-3-methyl-5-hydroxy-6-metoxy-1,4-benzoquinol methylase
MGSYESSYDISEIRYFNNKLEQKYDCFQRIFNKKIGSFLDIGSGEGFALKYFDSLGWEVTGLDFSNSGVKRHNPKQEIFLIDGDIFENLNKIISSNKKFDLILLDNVLEHVTDPFELLKNISQIISNTGCLIIEVPNDFSLFQQYLLDNGHIDREFWVAPPDHLSYFNKNGLISIADDSGWKIEKAMSDFPIDLDLLNKHTNYVNNPAVGKASHGRRIEFENFIHSISVNKANKFYESLMDLGLGREIIGFFSKK